VFVEQLDWRNQLERIAMTQVTERPDLGEVEAGGEVAGE
jgi:hypothetical protein